MRQDRKKINERIALYREHQHQKGMIVVRVWVPTEADGDEIKRIAAEMRQRAEKDNGIEATN
jgi:uncharacterized membrane protein